MENWLVVSTHVKKISQMGNLPQIGVKIKNIGNHHLEKRPHTGESATPAWKAKDTPIFKATGLLVLGVFSCPKK